MLLPNKVNRFSCIYKYASILSQFPAIETIAKVIDNSAMILLCLSDLYEQDNHCQAVAEYAFNSKRFILPLIVQKGYKIDRWLTSIINDDTPIDFSTPDFKSSSSLLIEKIDQYHQTRLSDEKSRTTTPIKLAQTVRFPSCAVINRQEEQISGHVISKSVTPVNTLTTSNQQEKDVTEPAISKVNGIDEKYLPEKYTKRDTSNSMYHFLPVILWQNKELLDFLYDSDLNLMMPLCESMTGRILIQFFLRCETKPNRLYKQLNENLHHRFKGFTLPIGVYIQFLSEIDRLLHSEHETSRLSANNTKHLVYPPDIAHLQSSILDSIKSSTRSKSPSLIKTKSDQTTSRNARVIIRTIVQPDLLNIVK